MVIKDFTKPEADFLLENCNFTEEEEKLFRMRLKGVPLVEIREELHLTRRTCDNRSASVNRKIIRVIGKMKTPL